MNIQQLQYVLAVDEHRHFQKAAAACFVTPAALSIMLKRLEEELDIIIFDRSRQPILPTNAGEIVIKHAREVMATIQHMESAIQANQSGNMMNGVLRIGIIPTLAPYLLHLFLPKMIKKYPHLKIELKELRTETILDQLRKNNLDVGLIAIQNDMEEFKATPLFKERLLVFVSEQEPSLHHQYLLAKDIDVNRLWLLEEEHCLRSQVMNLCSLKKKAQDMVQLHFEAGSIESLMNIVEVSKGITVIPELASISLSKQRKKQIRAFADPVPVREIGMLTYRHFVKENMLEVLADEIKEAVSDKINTSGKVKVIR